MYDEVKNVAYLSVIKGIFKYESIERYETFCCVLSCYKVAICNYICLRCIIF